MGQRPHTTALTSHNSALLAPGNPSVRAIVARTGWRTSTLVRRVSSALSSPTEQEIYLRVAESVRIFPETIAKMLRGLLGSRTLQPHDMISVPRGKNLSTNLFVETLDLLLETVTVTHVLREQYGSISAEDATTLVKAYGPDQVEIVADSIARHLEEYFEYPSEKRMALALIWFAKKGIAYCDEKGIALPHDVGEWIERNPEIGRQLYRHIGFPDAHWRRGQR